jgi:hypothetical protein
MTETLERCEETQPWVIYVYGLTHDKWWPIWNSTRLLGYAKIECQCCICGDRTVLKLRLPRFGPIPARVAYLKEHEHPLQQRAPETWAWPLRNMRALSGGDALDILRDVAERAVREKP